MPSEIPNRVFISWSSEDPRVEKIAEIFKAWFEVVFKEKIDFFYSKDIAPGKNSWAEIEKNLTDAKFAFFFLSQRTTKSSWVVFEAGCLRRLLDAGNAYFLLTDITISDFKTLCPPLAGFQVSQIDTKDDIMAVVRTICERLEISTSESLEIKARAEKEYTIIEESLKETIETVQLLPDAYTGLLPYGDTIDCSSNFKMPKIFSEFKRELFLVGINMNFLLNLKTDSANFERMLYVLMKNPQKKINICISDIWEEHLQYCYNNIVHNKANVEMEGLTEVFKDTKSDIYLDTFIKKITGYKYDQITTQLTIKTIEMLVDTFWFVDADEKKKSGVMMLIPMTSWSGLERAVFFASQKNQGFLFSKYYNLCKTGFESCKPVWPLNQQPCPE
jgi:hypothetical protein